MIDLKKQLNRSQLAAVTAIDGAVLVIAGAGSGKTRAIEYRVLHLIENNIAPESILLLTFTRKAAREMLSRAEARDARARLIDGGTFHSFAYKTLKRYAKAIGFPQSFTILDESDSADAVHKCVVKIGQPDAEKRFPRKGTLKSIISASINKDMSIVKILERDYPHFMEYATWIEKVRKAYAEYKVGKNYLDYDDLLVYLKLLLENGSVKRAIAERYKYVMVDEYQDTNKLQGDITYLLAKENRNIMVVGDDAQSIYGFRGSSHENIMAFPKMFPGCRIIKLEENYRSSQTILDVANAALENMDNKYSKCLISTRGQSGQKPKLLFFKDAYREAEHLAEKITMLRAEGQNLADIAVLFRSAYISIPLQAELSRLNIPYQIFGGLKFYETSHVKDLMAHLKVVANPKDELAWTRMLELIEGIGPKSADRLTEDMAKYSTLSDMVKNVLQKNTKGYKYSASLGKLAAALVSVSSKKLSNESRYGIILDYYTPLLKDKFDDWHLRINDLEALRQITGRYESLDELLSDLAIEPPERGVRAIETTTPIDELPLTLSTIHSAKGLEWKTVFVIGVVDGVLPISFALDHDDEIEEENRLFYVAVTRAKDSLFLSLHHEGTRGGINQFNKVSRFVDRPNVISCLDQEAVFQAGLDQTLPFEDAIDDIDIFDKEDLLRNIIGRYK